MRAFAGQVELASSVIRTGETGETSEGETLGAYYIASDGAVAVASHEDSLVRGVDPATCDSLWSLPIPEVGEATGVWKVDSALIQRTNDRLSSLVAPS
ncbi:hypothetical protein [Mycolicibacterium sp.]|uniref:hypothetical protein n=1 Tax=Mycolicibacterium sp. TaxID=2320850 RepID=UPI003D0B14AB